MDILSGIHVRGDSSFHGRFDVHGENDVYLYGGYFSSGFKTGSYNVSKIPLITNSDVSIPSGCSSFYVPGVYISAVPDFINAFATQIVEGEIGEFKTVEVDSKIICGATSPIITVVPKDVDWSLTIHVLHY